ncbi:hypothetical protein ACGFY7_36730 [Streptomyces prunicolor]|uniref:hypothetical protein n=1 Tax=Streptomyces prunicolor TaxID=67348 RepID=UPI00371916EE
MYSRSLQARTSGFSEPAPDPLPAHVSWDLLHRCPEASAAALGDSPIAVVWHFQLDATREG